MVFQILSLSGGGFLGLYTASVLAEIEQRTGRPLADSFDLIVREGTLPDDGIEVQRKRGEGLRGLVMEFEGDPSALVFLGGEHATDEVLEAGAQVEAGAALVVLTAEDAQ